MFPSAPGSGHGFSQLISLVVFLFLQIWEFSVLGGGERVYVLHGEDLETWFLSHHLLEKQTNKQ